MRKSDANSLKNKGMRIINIKIKDSLYKEIRQEAIMHDMSTNDLICKFLVDKLIDETVVDIQELKKILEEIN